VILARDDQDVCTGLIAALKSTVPFLYGTVGLEWAWYSQNPRSGLKLLDAFEYWCVAVANVSHIQLSSLTGKYSSRLHKLYQSRGYRQTELSYIRTL
jgi:hypothetical protein